MPQPIDTSPPWWDGTISIPFSVDEWRYIIEVLKDDLVYHYGLLTQESNSVTLNLIDRIEKGIGLE